MRSLTFVLLAGLYGAAQAAAPVGQVVEISGPVSSGPDLLSSGYRIEEGARVTADKGAEVSLRMLDDSLVLLNQSSDLLIEKFAFDPLPGNSSANGGSYFLYQGIVRMVPGALARSKPNAVTLSTSYGDVVSSGSDYTAGLCGVGCGDEKGLYVCVRSGQANVSGTGDQNKVGPGQCGHVRKPCERPTQPGEAGDNNGNGQSRSRNRDRAGNGRDQCEARLSVTAGVPGFMVTLVSDPLTASVDFRESDIPRLRRDAQDFLDGVIDPPASPSQPLASNSR